jgi:hypothetical protein
MRPFTEPEIRLYAFAQNDSGTLSITDIVETSRQGAPYFVRMFRRHYPDCVAIAATAPGNTIMPEARYWDGRRVQP